MAIIGVVGLSGSGKSTLMRTYVDQDYRLFDDIGTQSDWTAHAGAIRKAAQNGNVIVSDILFCCKSPESVASFLGATGLQIHGYEGRDHFADQVGMPITWIFFRKQSTSMREELCATRF